MSESRSKLENILELLLAEENEKAEEMLHEYVVAKARAEYERVLDEDSSEEEVEVEESEESEEEAVEESEEVEEVEEVDEVIDQSNDFEDDILADEEEIDADEFGEEDDEESEEMGDEDLEDKVDNLEDELEDLKAEFEKLLADEEGDDMEDGEEAEMDSDDMDMEDELDLESVEYDLDEEVADEDEVVEEATKLQDKVADPKGGAGDSEGESPLTKTPKKTTVSGAGQPVKAKDGSDGDMGNNKPADHTPSDNIKVEPKKA